MWVLNKILVPHNFIDHSRLPGPGDECQVKVGLRQMRVCRQYLDMDPTKSELQERLRLKQHSPIAWYSFQTWEGWYCPFCASVKCDAMLLAAKVGRSPFDTNNYVSNTMNKPHLPSTEEFLGFCVYEIVHRATGKAYVGMAKNVSSRWYGHLLQAFHANNTLPLYEDMRKFGIEAFDFRVLQVCKNEEEADDRESWFIANRVNHMEPVYNILKTTRIGWGPHGRDNPYIRQVPSRRRNGMTDDGHPVEPGQVPTKRPVSSPTTAPGKFATNAEPDSSAINEKATQRPKRRYVRMTLGMMADVVRMRQAGCYIHEIAKALGISASCVSNHLRGIQ